jgi:hypothetical protein
MEWDLVPLSNPIHISSHLHFVMVYSMVVVDIGWSFVLMGWWYSGHHPKAPLPGYIIIYLLKRGT